MNLIESINNDKVKLWKKLRNKKYIDKYGLYIIEGYHLVEEAIRNNIVEYLIILNDIKYNTKLPIYNVNEKVMKNITLMKSIPEVMAVVKVTHKKKEYGKKIIFLDEVQDPGNVGTIIRSSVAFNFDTVVLTDNSASIYNEKVIRSTEGMIFSTNIITGKRKELLEELKKLNYKIYSTTVNGNITPEEIKEDKFVIILGNEGNGVSQESLKFSDNTVKIPINNKCESLNVAICGAIIMYIKR